jgi:hypothetical protein
LNFYEGVGVLKLENSESEVLKIEESESELWCTDSTALAAASVAKQTIPPSRVLFEKVTGLQLVKELHTF